eukprot:CAMPEP_0184305638 /NCGR_PEP_ID=MMETSP1049-20130417/14862_1 /TAXON_ID=77928 /ORGANISM="Proteomonas sulcata, Strain CCMP704" /LENGTH=167 /DNA_ID=CAMNT_0026617745 /DNA_START=243 /DNA_END=746 /DNA_ORIENTATION=+
MAKQNMLGIKACTGLMLGANVGTCVTGMLAAIGQTREAVRLAVALLLVRIVATAMVLPLQDYFNDLVAMLCGVSATSTDPAEVTIFLATSHTVFNCILAFSAMPFTSQWAAVVRMILPDESHRPSRLTSVRISKATDKKPQKLRASRSYGASPPSGSSGASTSTPKS